MSNSFLSQLYEFHGEVVMVVGVRSGPGALAVDMRFVVTRASAGTFTDGSKSAHKHHIGWERVVSDEL